MKRVVIYVILTATFFATMEVALKIAGAELDPLQLTFLRFLIGGLVLAPPAVIEIRKSGYRFTRGDWLWMLSIGVMGVPISMLAFQLGVQRCNAATAASLICTNSLFTMVIAHIFTSEKMNRRKWTAFCIGLVAIVFMIRPWDVQPGNTLIGMIIMLFAAVTFGAYTVMGRQSVTRLGAVPQTCISFILGSIVLLIVILLTGHPVIAGVAQNPGIVLYCGLVVTGLGYLFYFLAIKGSDATTASITFFIKPAIAPIFAMVILHETVYWNTVIGILLLVSASAIVLADAFRSRSQNAQDT